jgi:hypothetical protein
MKRFAALLMAVLMTAGMSGQTKRMAVTSLSENMMRLKPDYESPLETQSLMGTIVEIIGEEGYWRQVVTPEPYTAWCTDLGLVEMTQPSSPNQTPRLGAGRETTEVFLFVFGDPSTLR